MSLTLSSPRRIHGRRLLGRHATRSLRAVALCCGSCSTSHSNVEQCNSIYVQSLCNPSPHARCSGQPASSGYRGCVLEPGDCRRSNGNNITTLPASPTPADHAGLLALKAVPSIASKAPPAARHMLACTIAEACAWRSCLKASPTIANRASPPAQAPKGVPKRRRPPRVTSSPAPSLALGAAA